MKEIFDLTVKLFFQFGEGISLILEIISVLCIAAGMVVSLNLFLKLKQKSVTPLHNRVRVKFGGWLALALEFQLASDIVKTTVNPTYENLIIVGSVALIRTFLNYFLNRELKEEMEAQKKSAETLIQNSN
ncbi:MAG: DUF1622 domain-containing protein [Ignavibacteriae bacterium]|jgi:uncharacterized membrane protein|nr:DUF1622 domain-containing protein [Ignavibacteriota bacterium]